jgi:uncharacterized phage protein (TIGR02218 family)
MTYLAHEESEQQGAPVELYEFITEDTTYRYTSAEVDVIYASNTYTSEAIYRTPLALSVETVRNALTLTLRRNNDVTDLFRISPPDNPVGLIVKRFHRGDSEVATVWVGRVLNVSWQDTSGAQMQCEPASISMNRNGLGRYYQVPCPYALYNADDCKVDRAAFTHATTVTAISGLTVTVASKHSTHPYPGGFIEFTTGAPPITERRLITAVSGNVFTLSRRFSDALIVTSAVSLLAGCDHTMATCNGVFNNKLNYGGFIAMPKKNPFAGTPVF